MSHFSFMYKNAQRSLSFYQQKLTSPHKYMDCDINLQIPEHQTLADPGHFPASLYISQHSSLKSLSVCQLSKNQPIQKCG